MSDASKVVQVDLINGPLPPAQQSSPAGAGAVVCFEGVVRPTEESQPLAALEYEAYEPMTSRELRRVAEQAVADYRLLWLRVEHSVGRVEASQTSFRLTLGGRHRKESLAAADWFIDTMKREVPLWKNPLWEWRRRING